jgi:hypothetical protein
VNQTSAHIETLANIRRAGEVVTGALGHVSVLFSSYRLAIAKAAEDLGVDASRLQAEADELVASHLARIGVIPERLLAITRRNDRPLAQLLQ